MRKFAQLMISPGLRGRFARITSPSTRVAVDFHKLATMFIAAAEAAKLGPVQPHPAAYARVCDKPPKTIDNDLMKSDHTPRFIVAGAFVGNAFASVDLDVQALQGSYCAVVMGRPAAVLAEAEAQPRRTLVEAPILAVMNPDREPVICEVQIAKWREIEARCRSGVPAVELCFRCYFLNGLRKYWEAAHSPNDGDILRCTACGCDIFIPF